MHPLPHFPTSGPGSVARRFMMFRKVARGRDADRLLTKGRGPRGVDIQH
jgi:hypothetical protein